MTGKTGSVNTDYQETLQNDENGDVSNLSYTRVRAYHFFALIEASGLLSQIGVVDKIATISSETNQLENNPQSGSKTKFIIGGLLIVTAIIYLIVSSAAANAQYFLTVEETLEKSEAGELDGRNLRISGAVIGDTIQYDSKTLKLTTSFTFL